MNEWLRQFQQMEKPEQAIRALVIGGTALLLLMATVDVISGKGRQDVVAASRVDSTTSDVAVAPEAEAPTEAAPEDVTTDTDEPALAEADAVEETPEEMADERTTDTADEPAMAEADAIEEAPEVTATDAEDEPAMAEADATEDAPEEMAADTATDAADETALAEADATEDAPEAMAAEEATDAAAPEEIASDATTDAADEPAMAEADAVEEAAEDSGVSALLASADPDNGQRVFRQCAACHVYNAEQNRGGPHLVNVVGRDIGVIDGWRYSRALSEHGGVWTVESLLAWLENPDSYIPGNQMAFRGLRNEQDRIDVLGFLEANRTD